GPRRHGAGDPGDLPGLRGQPFLLPARREQPAARLHPRGLAGRRGDGVAYAGRATRSPAGAGPRHGGQTRPHGGTPRLPRDTGEDVSMQYDAMPDPRDVALTGPPRSGTTLVCHLLNKLPGAVALNEPMKVSEFPKLPDRWAMCDAIQAFFAESRRSLLESGSAYSRHVSGKVPDNVVGAGRAPGGLRKDDAVRGLIRIEKPLPEGFLLAVKH